MNIGSIKFNLKYILKNILFLLSLIIVLFFSTIFAFEYQVGGLTNILKFSAYGIMGYNVFLSILVTYMSGTDIEIMTYFNMSNFKKNLNLFISFLISSLIPLFISLIISLIKVPLNSLLVNEVLDFFIIWLSSSIVSISFGLFAGMLNKGYIKYAIIFALDSIVLLFALGRFNVITSLFNIFPDGVTSFGNPFVKTLISKYYLLDKLFLIILVALLLVIGSSIVSKKFRLKLIPFILILLVSAALVINSSYNSISFALPSENSFYFSDVNYSIEDYSMNLNLDNKLSNHCSIKLILTDTEIKELSFLLSNLYSVETVEIEGEKVNFIQDKDTLLVKTDTVDLKNTLTINITYKGDVFYSYLSNANQYVSNEFINLNEFDLQWYPTIRQDKLINFDVSLINNNKEIISNLDFIDDAKLKGKSTGVFIGKGAYKTITSKNIQIHGPNSAINDNIIIDNTNTTLSSLIEYTKENHADCKEPKYCIHNIFSESNFKTISNNNISKVIYVPAFNGISTNSNYISWVWLYSDTLIIGSGF